MKRLYRIFFITMVIGSCLSCTKDWLKPNQPSKLDDNAYNTVSGCNGLIMRLCKELRPEVMGRNSNMKWAYEGTDLAVLVNGSPRDYDGKVNPSMGAKDKDLWDAAFKQVTLSAILVTRADNVDGSQSDRNTIRANGQFFMAYWYYRLITTYGDVPLITSEISEPKLDFKTSTQRRIISTMIGFLEQAVKVMPVSVPAGQINRAAANMLLTKYYLMDGQFDKAIESASAVIATPGLKLMQSRFGALVGAKNPKIPNPNVMTDLFYKYNASDPANTEKILVVLDNPYLVGGTAGSAGGERMREYLTEWYKHNLDGSGGGLNGQGSGLESCIDGGTGSYGPLGAAADLQILWIGRGIGASKKTWYFHNNVWAGGDFDNDMRHTAPNWYPMEALVYNKVGSNVFGQNLKRENCSDTLKGWDCIFYNKIVVDDERRVATEYNLMGGCMDCYIYRLPEAHLLRAEALVWLNRGGEALEDINIIRDRAGAKPLKSAVTMDDVLDERARELYLEEFRKNELVRISYTKAKLNLDGYSMNNIGTKNWFYDRISKTNNIYFDVATGQPRNFEYGTDGKNPQIYKISPYHIYWPVPESAINDNTLARINQNYGYIGYDKNIVPIDID